MNGIYEVLYKAPDEAMWRIESSLYEPLNRSLYEAVYDVKDI